MKEILNSRGFDLGEKYRNILFPGRRQEEQVILILRRHWLILVKRMIPFVFYLLVIVIFGTVGPDIMAIAPFGLGEDFFSLGISFLFMLFWLILFIVWLDYYLDVWIVSDQRIINIEQFGLFNRSISELEHPKIQDVTSEVHGVISTLFNFGYIYVQTAGEKERFVFKQIPNPVEVRNIIMRLQQNAIIREKKKEGEIMRGKL